MSASPEDKKREQAHFQALQSVHGFSNASSGVCSLCHERDHDQQGCPRAPHNIRWAIAIPMDCSDREMLPAGVCCLHQCSSSCYQSPTA